jgi:hypothetical protein
MRSVHANPQRARMMRGASPKHGVWLPRPCRGRLRAWMMCARGGTALRRILETDRSGDALSEWGLPAAFGRRRLGKTWQG